MVLVAISKKELPLYAPFVLPNLCSELKKQGFPVNTLHQWKVYPEKISLSSYAFDEDDYYKDGNKLKDLVFPDVCQFPAYTIKDVEKCIPASNYELFVESGTYCLSFCVNERTYKFHDQRMPDVFAKAAIAMASNGFLNMMVIQELIVGE